jgi:hypothetical protein
VSGHSSQGADDSGPYQIDLSGQIPFATADLIFLRVAILRRTTLHDISNVHILAFQIDRGQHFRKQLSRTPYKRLPAQILFSTRSFADKHNLCCRVPLAKNRVRPFFVKSTLFTRSYLRGQFGQRLTHCVGGVFDVHSISLFCRA